MGLIVFLILVFYVHGVMESFMPNGQFLQTVYYIQGVGTTEEGEVRIFDVGNGLVQ